MTLKLNFRIHWYTNFLLKFLNLLSQRALRCFTPLNKTYDNKSLDSFSFL